MGFFSGSKPKTTQTSLLSKQQRPLESQLINAGMGQGAGGAFGSAADYYYNNLSDNPADFQAFAAPEMRKFNEEIIPGLSEQFAGMGSGALSSSGFRNAAVSAGTDLSERLAAMRAKLRESAAQGLQNIGTNGLEQRTQTTQSPGQGGFLSQVGGLLGPVATAALGPVGGAVGAFAGNAINNYLGNNKQQQQQPANSWRA
jgi:hypothetical protein